MPAASSFGQTEPPPASAAAVKPETRTVVAGKEFDRGGNWRFWFGEGYRKAWTTPVELPVLDLTREAGGLTPLRQIGGFQTEGLAMKGADGRGYTFRKLEKHPERVLPKEWQDERAAGGRDRPDLGRAPGGDGHRRLARAVGRHPVLRLAAGRDAGRSGAR